MKTKLNRELLGKVTYCADEMIGRNLKIFSASTIKKSIRTRNIVRDPFFWNNGILSMAISEYQNINQRTVFKNNERLLSKKASIKYVDNALFCYANYEKLSKNELDSVLYYLKMTAKDSAGSILYRAYNPSAYIDTLGMVCPFLFRYAKNTNSPEATTLALSQFELFFDNGFDTNSGLPYHGYNIDKAQKDGIIGWGRGIGWIMFGLADSLAWTDDTSPEHKALKSMFAILYEKVAPHQRADGSYSWQLQAQDGPLDISATSMIGYSLSKFSKATKTKRYEQALQRIEACVLRNIDDAGHATNSSAECRGFSMYPQRYEINSWGQGFTALFLIDRFTK